MEALYSSTIAPSKAAMHASPVARSQISSLSFYRRRGSLFSVKVARRGLVHQRCRLGVRALAKELDGDGGDDGGANDDQNFVGVGFIDEDKLSFSENTSNQIIGDKNASVTVEHEKTDEGTLTSGASAASTAQRAGLCRTPISGGVQSATSVHDLPRPALAVRNLMEQARYAQLCTLMSRMHHRREGYPFGSLVDFATDEMGHPIFQFSPLAIHTRNLLADSRCTLVVQIPGWSGLSNARVTVFGDIKPLPNELQEWACQRYIAKHQQRGSQQWENFCYYRMQTISDIYFIGGFGTVAWVDVKEYEGLQPDRIAINGGEQNLKELNAAFSKKLKEILSTDIEVDDAVLISVDCKGTDIRVRQGTKFNIQRLSFEVEYGVETLEEAKAALQKIIDKNAKQRRHHRCT